MRLDVKILDARLHESAPAYATAGSAGLDLRACVQAPLPLGPGATALVPSGIAIHLAKDRVDKRRGRGLTGAFD